MTSDALCGLHVSLICNGMNGEQHTHDNNNPVTMTRAKWNSVESASSVALLNGNKIDSFILIQKPIQNLDLLSSHGLTMNVLN